MNDLDRRICLWINHWPEGLTPVMRFFSEGTSVWYVKLFALVAVISMVIRNGKTRAAALLSILAVVIANGMTDLLKHGFPMHRPYQPEALGTQIILRLGGNSSFGTASAHAANMTAVATVLTLLLGRWGWPWIGVAVITGLSRIYLGEHFPSQVLLGATCGLVGGFVCVFGYRAVAGKVSKSEDG